MKFDWKAALPVVDFHPRILFPTKKFLFYGWLTLVWSHLFSKLAGSNYKSYWSHAGQVKRKVNFGELSVEITLLRLLHIVKALIETWQNPGVKVNSTIARSFQQKPFWEMDVMPNVNFAPSKSNNKDQLRDLFNYLNQQLITAINTYDNSTLGNNLITSQQVILCPQDSFQLKLLKITISIS